MTPNTIEISSVGRNAAVKRDWPTVRACARKLLELDGRSAEGYFLHGLATKAASRHAEAIDAFAASLAMDNERYDAAIELANQHCIVQQHTEAARLVDSFTGSLGNSPLYLHLAGSIYTRIGLPSKAWPLFVRANELQPGVETFLASLGTCAMFLGRIEDAVTIYRALVERSPNHQRHHYQLAQLQRATDTGHIDQMKSILVANGQPPDRNIFLYYAIGKEYEDLEEWQEAFRYFSKGADAVMSVARYDIETDLELIDRIVECCNAGWLEDRPSAPPSRHGPATPIFVVGLPRTGTTVVDRILSGHSQIGSVDETQYMPISIRRLTGVGGVEKMSSAMIEAAMRLDINAIGKSYMDMVRHRLGPERMFVDKLPFNVLYLGFIAKAFPDARLVLVNRGPLDSCFAMYKQVFLGTYKFSYSLENLGRFYVAYTRLVQHWRTVLGPRLVEIEYEALVRHPEQETRELLNSLGLGYESDCIEIDRNASAVATASSAQVREKVHTRSVGRWLRYADQLRGLKAHLESAGIATGESGEPEHRFT